MGDEIAGGGPRIDGSMGDDNAGGCPRIDGGGIVGPERRGGRGGFVEWKTGFLKNNISRDI
jgi:hypothetical protein